MSHAQSIIVTYDLARLAITHALPLHIVYCDVDGVRSHRVFSPSALSTSKVGADLLHGTDAGQGIARTLRLDRVQAVRLA